MPPSCPTSWPDGRSSTAGPALDRAVLADVIMALGSLLAADPRITKIEINPPRLTAGSLVALDTICAAVDLEVSARHAHQ